MDQPTISREPEVRIEIDKLKKVVEACLQLTGTLECKLERVLRPVSPMVEQVKKPQVILAPLAQELFSENERLDSIVRYLETLLGRLEV